MKQDSPPFCLFPIRFFIFFICWLFTFTGSVSAQFKSYLGNYSHNPSPEAASAIAKNQVTAEVDKYTGTVNVQVPLYTVSIGGIQIPVALFYRTTGNKVEEMGGTMGKGWNLSGGGKITRVVKRRDDNQSVYGYLTARDLTDINYWTPENFDKTLRKYDSEPDLFYFDYPGNSGMFVIDNITKQAYTIPYQPLQIEWVNRDNPTFNYFQIKDLNGTVYIFNYRENMETTVEREDENGNPCQETDSYISCWYLGRIEDMTGERVDFSYAEGDSYSFTARDSRMIIKYHHVIDDELSRNFLMEEETTINMDTRIKIVNPLYPARITWRGGYIQFISKHYSYENRTKIEGMDIYYSGERVKSYLFSQGTSLNLIKEKAGNQEKLIARFDYWDSAPHSSDSNRIDHWGYYTSGTSSVFPYFQYNSGRWNGSFREADLVQSRSCCLKKITYTTGGSIDFEYELHATSLDVGGGLRIKSIRQLDTLTGKSHRTTYEYITPEGSPSGVRFNPNIQYHNLLGYRPATKKVLGVKIAYWVHYLSHNRKPLKGLNDHNGSPVGYSWVKETHPNGSYVFYHYTTSLDYPDLPCDLYEVRRGENTHSGSYSNHYLVPGSSQHWKRGLLKEIQSYTPRGELYSKQVYRYNLNSAVRKEIKALMPFYIGEGMDFGGGMSLQMRVLGVYKWQSQPVLLESVTTSGKDIFPETITYSYHPEYLLPLETLVTSRTGKPAKRTVIKYSCQMSRGNGTAHSEALWQMKERGVYSVPVEVVNYEGNKVVGATLNIFVQFAGGKIFPYKVCNLFLKTPVTNLIPYDNSNSHNIDPRYREVGYSDHYDTYGNVLIEHTLEGNYQYHIYGHNHTLRVATIESPSFLDPGAIHFFYEGFEENGQLLKNAKSGRKALRTNSYSIVLPNFSAGQFLLTYWKSKNGTDWIKTSRVLSIAERQGLHEVIPFPEGYEYIDEIRIHPVNARMTTRSYRPGVGVISETDHNGHSAHYEYDQFGRISMILDNKRCPVKRYDYRTISL